MVFLQAYLLCAGCIIISFLLPGLSKAVREQFGSGRPASVQRPEFLSQLWLQLRPYATLVAFSLLVALLIVASYPQYLKTWQDALLAGYTGQSLLEKVSGRT